MRRPCAAAPASSMRAAARSSRWTVERVPLTDAPQRYAKDMAAPLGGPIALPALWQRLRENAQ
jgi:hypothetical protein